MEVISLAYLIFSNSVWLYEKRKIFFFENEVTFFSCPCFQKNSLTEASTDTNSVFMTIVFSCLCFVSISRGLMTKPIGFLRVPPVIFVEQIVWFFSFLISPLFGPFF